MTEYRRHFQTGGTYFFTLNLHNRSSNLLTQHIDLLRQSFRHVMQAHPFEIDAIVVLPEHLHCIWILPETDANYSMRWRQIKAYFSRHLPKIETVNASRKSKNERGIWQRRFWEHAIRDEEDYRQHVDYIHNNPIKHGYCQSPAEWPYSSFNKFTTKTK
jgi:putative transposase